MTESQNQDVDEADDNASDSASEDMEIEDVEEENAETDLLEGEELQPVNDSTKIIEDPANPACGMIVDYYTGWFITGSLQQDPLFLQ